MHYSRSSILVIRVLLVAMISFVALEVYGLQAFAQTTTASIRGVVYDETGAVISGASVVATNETTGLSRSTISGENGAYLLSSLPVGIYTLTVEKEGFKRERLGGIILQVTQIAELNPKLSVGAISESVEVSTEAPLVNTTTPEIGDVIENRQIVELPLNGRQFLQLAQLSAGVTTSPGGSFGQLLAGANGPRITSNGGREDQNYFTLDGVNATDAFYHTLTISPSVDAIQEFKVETSLFSAESGVLGGALVNIVVKSGTNSLHGSVYEFLRNDHLDARNFFDIEKPPFRQNQYGFSVGGPILKNRTFFFGNFEGLRIRKGLTAGASVPTAAQRRGDLSSFPGPIKDPLTGGPFPNNIIPANRIDPASAEILGFIPLPNSSNPGRNLISTPSLKNDTDQFLVRIDHRLSEKDSIYGRYAYSNLDSFEPFGPIAQFSAGGAGNIAGFGQFLTSRGQNLAVSWTRAFTAALVGEFKFGYNRVQGGQLQENSGNNFGQRNNIPGIAQSGPLSGFPLFQTSVFTDFGDITLPLRRLTQTYQGFGSMSWAHGNHNMKVGGSGRWLKFDPVVDIIGRGQFLYFGSFTGNPFSDFLLGLPGFALAGQGDPDAKYRGGAWNFYVQDDWRVSKNLTINLGVRWEYFGNPSEKDLRAVTFDPTIRMFILASKNGQVNTRDQVPGVMAAIEKLFPFTTSEKAGLPRSLYRRDLNNFDPRLGFAWDMFGNQSTVLRGGYGIFANEATGNIHAIQVFSPPFFTLATVPGFLLPPAQANIHAILGVPPGANVFFNPRNPDFRDGYVQQWNLSLQQSMTSSLVVEARYLGSKGTKLFINDFSFNYAPPGDPATVGSRLPFPQFAPATRPNSIGNSSYNALQLRATQRLARGISFTINYTFGKSLDLDSLGQSLNSGNLLQDPTNFRLDHARSNFDVKHNFVANYVYDLPFRTSGRWKPILEGWELSGILSLQSGRPFHVNVNGDRAGTGNNVTQRPNVIGNPNLSSSQRTPERWFNVDALVLQPKGKVGNLGRSTLDADGFRAFDFSVIKNTRVAERLTVQFRAEFFNIFNFVNLGFPNQVFSPAGGITDAPAGAHNANPNLGRIFNALDPRIIQFGLKLLF